MPSQEIIHGNPKRSSLLVAGISFCAATGLVLLCWFALFRSPSLYHFQEVDAGKLYYK